MVVVTYFSGVFYDYFPFVLVVLHCNDDSFDELLSVTCDCGLHAVQSSANHCLSCHACCCFVAVASVNKRRALRTMMTNFSNVQCAYFCGTRLAKHPTSRL